MTATALQFNEELHQYSLGGVILPSVTQVLCAVNLIDARFYDDLSAWRGSVVHRICELDDQGELDEEDVDPRVAGYLDAWRKFKQAMQFKPDLIEHRVINEQLSYAGTLDRTGIINGGQKVIIDIKSGAPAPATGLQLTGYALCLPDPRTYQRYSVQVTVDGAYKMKQYPVTEFTSDRHTWEAAVRVFRFMEEKKIRWSQS